MNASPSHPSRRRFLLGTAGACAALGAGIWQSSRRSRHGEIVERTSHALGSSVTMTVFHRDRNHGEAALDAAFQELEQIENVMSIYRSESQLSRLNRQGVIDAPDARLVTVLKYATGLSERSDGAFDVTVQPLWELYRETQKSGFLPDENAVLQARNRVDWRRVEIAPDRIRLIGNGTAITLNGIAQGYAADAAMAALRRCGVVHALIDTGELGALGSKPDGEAWKVGIQHPREESAFISLAALRDRCLATSGDYQTRFGTGFSHHHLFDPHTGDSPTELASVSVAAPTAMAADALSTAVFVLGIDRGMELVRNSPDTDALLVAKDGRMLATDGFPADA